ncbi:coiled-coil domain-containing protein 43 [Fopius arisanus]|uniref:Coiled-coil domain-containing protein 43 n=2 Tax=Fopius arisanus TaxID=64838 RepID=A0A9R1T914_9HYME|nr:PREDICTED: coiled-coil domain-containing protein 43 [Fopius arisanus]
MADISDTFNSWLTDKLKSLNTDEVVYGNYIRAILDSNETEDEKSEALESVIAGITEENISEHVANILVAYKNLFSKELGPDVPEPTEDVEVRLARMMESQSLPTTTQRSYTAEELKIREAILSQYSQMSDGEEEEGDGEDDGVASGKPDCGIEKNTNAAAIVQQQREMREKAKLDSQKKKEKDKEDREKQKQMKEEKKEKRKTTKGERRR